MPAAVRRSTRNRLLSAASERPIATESSRSFWSRSRSAAAPSNKTRTVAATAKKVPLENLVSRDPLKYVERATRVVHMFADNPVDQSRCLYRPVRLTDPRMHRRQTPVRPPDLTKNWKYSSILYCRANCFQLPYKLLYPAILHNQSREAMRARQLLQLRKSHTLSRPCAESIDFAESAGRFRRRIQIELFASLCDHGPPQNLYLLRKYLPSPMYDSDV